MNASDTVRMADTTNLPNEGELLELLQKVKVAAQEFRRMSLPENKKNEVLRAASAQILLRQNEILEANAKDLSAVVSAISSDNPNERFNSSFIDRLTLTPERIAQMRESLEQVAALPNPIGEEVEARTLANGLYIRKIRAPLGVIFMIFESRPNVIIEAFSLAFKAGNAIILRGGKESTKTATILYGILRAALKEGRMPEDILLGIQNPDRSIINFLLKQKQLIDVVVPRGGEGLIDFVSKTSLIPIIKNDRGLCHVYLHEDADFEMSERIIINAKTQRPGVCNAMETLLIHEKIADTFLPRLYEKLTGSCAKPVCWHVCQKTRNILGENDQLLLARAEDWDTEYLDLIMNCKVVPDLESAINHIEQHGSKHSEAIVTSTEAVARRFQAEVDAAAVYWNASTRFTDGFELGLGGELGISTQKLHVRGPVGLRELTSIRWVMDGTGQVRK